MVCVVWDYRARCFASEEMKQKFYEQGDADKMRLEDILDKLKSDMSRSNK